MKSGEQIFRPKARIIKSLGDELISNEYVAINELIKNSYDAKATFVDVALFKDRIIIRDDGDGMTLEQLKKGWFEPATDMKVGKKEVLGEKGIGRFATVKLARKLNLLTKAVGHNCIECNFDWRVFNENKDAYLDEIKIKWMENSDSLIKNKGTILTLRELDVDWLSEDRIKDLKAFLSRMINPFDEISDFKIRLTVGEKTTDILPSEVLKHPHYEIKGSFSDNRVSIFYQGLKIKDKILVDVKKPAFFSCGDFNFIFRIWDRDIEDMRELSEKLNINRKKIKDDLDEAIGISIYRDKFRVLPYGEKNNDWLRLDHRRIQNPTMRLGNNQIVGYISVSKEKNRELKDKTNREGLVENTEYHSFVDIIKNCILKTVEEKRYNERAPKRKEINAREPYQFIKEFNLDEVSGYVKTKYPEDKTLVGKIEKKESEIIEQGKEFQKLIIRYRRLSTLGQLLESVIHEFKNSFAGISANIGLIENCSKENVKVLEYARSIRDGQNSVSQFINRLKPFAERNSDRKNILNVKDEIKNILEIKKYELEKNKIKVLLPENTFNINMRSVDLFSIFSNLIDNSVYWLKEANKEDNRCIIIRLDESGGRDSIIFSDNGPNVPVEYREKIFDPYFSLKKDGTGLGLSIVGEIVSENDGSFDFVEDSEYEGATFKITF